MGIAIIVTTASLGGVALLDHTTCEELRSIGTELYWTPYALANAPFRGSSMYGANFTLYDLFGIDHVVLSDGHVANGNISVGYFQTENWTVFAQSNTSSLGPGVNQPCRSAFGAQQSPTNFSISVDGAVLQGPGNTSNVNEPTEYSSGEPNRSVVFANGFVSANRPSISTCGAVGKTVNFTSSSFGISLSIVTADGPVIAIASVISTQTFTYEFPANGGTWLVDDLQSNTGLQGPGLAFNWEQC